MISYARPVSGKRDETGCRDAAVATLFLLGFAVVFMITGLAMSQSVDCQGLCETAALTLLYAGGPLSALLGVIFGSLWVAWPLEITLWVIIGFGTARLAARRSLGVLGPVTLILGLALLYGLVLSQLVEIAR